MDFALTSLFTQALGENGTGSLARAMSSLTTILSSMAYYDQMPQFKKTGNTTQTYFTTVLFPQSHLGFWAVIVVLTVHVGLVSLIAVGFAVYSRNTLLNNHWHWVAQLQGPKTEDLIARTHMATDDDVKKGLSAAGHEYIRVGVRELKSGYGEVAVHNGLFKLLMPDLEGSA
ncbi:hypothetical protein LTR37_011258 [Vermiconidia calcicola]|uniref:Uncharacterized protein n=1 Tax=Vermiconidia calcicola TaxID=1690605 RepID=A0ACC3N4G2_9PEZI|nr:hypothetical protein LTR37_011258 [Vermiconidia calcicola]